MVSVETSLTEAGRGLLAFKRSYDGSEPLDGLLETQRALLVASSIVDELVERQKRDSTPLGWDSASGDLSTPDAVKALLARRRGTLV